MPVSGSQTHSLSLLRFLLKGLIQSRWLLCASDHSPDGEEVGLSGQTTMSKLHDPGWMYQLCDLEQSHDLFRPQLPHPLNGDNKGVCLLLLLGGLSEILYIKHKAWHGGALKCWLTMIIVIINHLHHHILLVRLKVATKVNEREPCL